MSDNEASAAIDNIFDKWTDLEEKIDCFSRLMRYIANRIDSRNRRFDVPLEISARSESVFLLLRRTLSSLAPEAREQIVRLLDESNSENTIASIASLSDSNRRRLIIRQSGQISAKILRSLGLLNIQINETTANLLKEEQLHATKIALYRIAAMLDYARKDLEQEEVIDDYFYRQHYNPKNIDRTRVTSLLDLLHQQIEALPADSAKENLLSNVAELKRELARPRPRWRSMIGKAIVMLAVVADINSLYPSLKNDALQTIDAIIRTIVIESQVTNHRVPVRTKDDGPTHWAIEPKRLEFRPPKDEDDLGTDG